MYAVHLDEPDRQRLYHLAQTDGHKTAVDALKLACPTSRGLTDDECPCHPTTTGEWPEQQMIVNTPAGQTWERRTTALMVLNPRAIPECFHAIDALNVDKCWISYMPEPQAAEAINEQIQATNYDRYVIISDDCAPTQQALDSVLELNDQGHDAVTGYCNLDAHLPFCNLTSNTLPPPPPRAHDYDFLTTEAVQAHEGPVTTTFAGLALTCMARHMWLSYPLNVTSLGGQMDYDLSYRLAQGGIPIMAAPDGFVQHVKERWNHPDRAPEKRLLLGQRPPAVSWTQAAVLA